MKKTKSTIIGILLFVLSSASVFGQTELPEKFTSPMELAGMTFTMPPNWEPVDPIDNPHMNYEYALKHKSGKLEIRYAIRPMNEQLAGYEKRKNDPNSIILATPNDVARTMYIAIAMNVSGNMNPKDIRSIPLGSTKEAIKKEFGADDGVTVILDEIREGFSKDYKKCMFISYWKEDLGTACVFIMLDEISDLNNAELIADFMPAFYSLKFK